MIARRMNLAASLCRYGFSVWTPWVPRNNPHGRILGVRCLNEIRLHETFLKNGWMKPFSEDVEGMEPEQCHWTTNPGQKELKTLIQMFSELEDKKRNMSALIHFDYLVNTWAKKSKHPEFAEKWMKHRLQKKMNKMLKMSLILGYMNSFTGLSPSEVDENQILKCFMEIKDDIIYADSSTFAMVIEPLCMTSKYKDCLELVRNYNKSIENIKAVTPINIANHLHHIVNAAFRYGDRDVSEALIGQYKDNLSAAVVEKLWQGLLHQSDKLPVDYTLRLLGVIQHFYPSDHRVEDLKQALIIQGKQPQITETFVTRDETCKNCGATVGQCHFNEKSLERIQASIFETLNKHHSETFQTFLQFLKRHGKFDFVVDGMWVMHKFTGGSAYTQAERMQSGELMKDFLLRELPGQKLVIGRNILFQMVGDILEHPSITRFPVRYSRDERMKAASGIDDLFVLYAALHSQPDSYIISGDFMNDHKKQIDSELQDFYSRWMSSRTIHPKLYYSPKTILKCHKHFTPKPVTKTENGWHIVTSSIPLQTKRHTDNIRPTLWCVQE
ncbi:mitochondrial ribonuclease P catalytic subunit-like isoform X2 [Saccostrea cucullata]